MPKDRKKVTVIYSGGLDSTVLLYKLVAEYYDVHAVTFDYGQRHVRELKSAQWHVENLMIRHTTVDLSRLGALMSGSSQTDETIDVPLGHYEDASMRATVVPNRNMTFVAAATAVALANNSRIVAYGAHAGDHSVYPDCRPKFVARMRSLLAVCDYERVKLLAPFITMTKADIVRIGHGLRVPMHLTWSCYQGRDAHCGLCGTCVERREAFQRADVVDRTIYESQQ